MSQIFDSFNIFWVEGDDLDPAHFAHIAHPFFAWEDIQEEMDNDQQSYLEVLQRIAQERMSGEVPAPSEAQCQQSLEKMVACGEVVWLEDQPTGLFVIDQAGQLICTDIYAFEDEGVDNISQAYRHAVHRCQYDNASFIPSLADNEVTHSALSSQKTSSTLNSKNVGRLLAAGGIYNQNPQMFAETAKKLGGEAPEGFSQVLNQQSAGSLIALSSLLMLGRASVAGRPSMAALEELGHFLGKSRQQHKLLDNIDVLKMKYIRRDRGELDILRRKFDSVERKRFLKSIADRPEVRQRLGREAIESMKNGNRPNGWSVHHKLPLDDSGSNALDNLVLIKEPEHQLLTNAQQRVMRGMVVGSSKEILWPIPRGIIYP